MKSKLVKTGLILYILSYIGGVISALFYQNLGMGFGLLYYYMLFPLFASLIGIGIGWHRFFAGIGILFGLFFLSSLHTCLVGGTMDLF
ncbi:MAG: hypothetical protein LBD38_05070, partial [Streptococcaceae bacterium]|nr:hypothetical protein [Streptococcaceae bacterium]